MEKGPAGLACAKEADAEACRFLEDFDAKGIEFNHPFLQGVKFQDSASLKHFRENLDRTAGMGTSEVVLRAYADAYVQQFSLTWETVDYQLALGKSLMATSKQGDLIWTTGKILEVQAKDFLDEQRTTCSTYLENCDQRYEIYEMQGLVPHHFSKAQKILPRYRAAGLGYVVDAVRREMKENLGLGPEGEEGIDAIFSKGKIEASPVSGNLPGYELHRLTLEGGINIGLLIIGDPQKGARVDLFVDEQQGIKRSTLEHRYRGKIQFQGAVAMDDEKILLGTTIVNGQVKRIQTKSGFLDGLVIVDQQGSLKIADKRDLQLGEPAHLKKLVEEAGRSGISAVSAASLDPTGKREKWRNSNHDETVRLLFVFKDGKFGVLDAPGRSTNQALAVLYRLQQKHGALTRIVLCDRGLYDTAAYYKDGTERVALGSQDRPTRNAIVFYSDVSPAPQTTGASVLADAKTNP